MIVKKDESPKKKKNNNGNKRASHEQAEGEVSEGMPSELERRDDHLQNGRYGGRLEGPAPGPFFSRRKSLYFDSISLQSGRTGTLCCERIEGTS